MSQACPSPLRRLAGSLTRYDVVRLAILVAFAAFLADWATKSWALETLHRARPLGALMLTVERNDAFAFSTGSGTTPTFLVLAARFTALAALVLFSREIILHGRRYAAGMGLMVGGGFGNAADLLFREGGVVDFIGAGPFALPLAEEPTHFHLVFNTADIAVLLGLGLLAPLISNWALGAQRRVARWERRWLEGPGTGHTHPGRWNE